MGYSNGIISAPVNTDDVKTVLNETTHDVGALCLSAKINMWAKYKPEATGDYRSLTLEQRKNNNFGLVAGATYTSKTEFINAVKAGTFTGGWTYVKPTGNAWKRLDDFVSPDKSTGYNHKARSPFGTLNAFTGTLTSSTTNTLLIPCQAPEVNSGTDTGILNIADFQNANADYKNWYFGILLYHSSRQFMATATTPIGTSGDWQVNFGWLNPSYAATYKGVPFLSNKPFTVSGSDPSGVKIVGVGQQGVNIVLKSAGEQYIPFATCHYTSNTGNSVSYTVSIRNTTTASKTFNNVILELATSLTGANSTTFVSFGNITVAAGQTWTQSGTKLATSRNYNFCRLYYQGTTQTSWVNFEELEQPEQPVV